MKIGIIGSGSWGTALAQVLTDNRHDVMIWGRVLDEIVDISRYHRNERFFPGQILNDSIKATMNFDDLLDSELLILAVPTGAIEDVSKKIGSTFTHPVTIVNVAKGFHPTNHQRLSLVIKNNIPPTILKAVVSLIGPSHAEEVVVRLLTVVNAVSDDEESSKLVQNTFSNAYFRVYSSTDVIGAEIGVAVKNVIALASGILSGLGYGDNARAALITRGLAEISRYGVYYGAKPETFLGLTGVTCTSVHSRNFQAGLLIGQFDTAKIFWETNEKTVEGIFAAKVVYEEAIKNNISMPITEQVYKVLYEDAKPSDCIQILMSRELKAE
ncbi:MAG: NAD(P)H-dependent glycerol-3-phosphate dehydrogenase [Erysipelotrichaceae bacterium]|nr:MAG: NAD(P)H-dependent glycerol-3-phosphate dehydrogenase [Erysipelotrichaceae bacterium]